MSDQLPVPGAALGKDRVGRTGTLLLGAYLLLLLLSVFYVLIKLWPYPTPGVEEDEMTAAAALPPATDSSAVQGADTSLQEAPATPSEPAAVETSAATPSNQLTAALVPIWLECDPKLVPLYFKLASADRNNIPKCVSLFGRERPIWDEQRLLLIVLFAGALGSLLHGLRSFATYVGNQELRANWLAYYLTLPFAGPAVALVFYLVIRGGFFSPSSDFSETSPFGFAAFAALVGLFSQQAILKLKGVADTLFEKTPQENDSLGGSGAAGAPTIAKLERKATTAGGREDVLDVTGSGFAQGAQVEVNGKVRSADRITDSLLRLSLTDTDLSVLDNGGALRIVVVNPNDKRSGEVELA